MSDVVSEMAPLVQSSVSADALVEYHLSKNMRLVWADVAQIRQLVMSLVVSACESVGDRVGLVDVSTGIVEGDEELLEKTFFDEGRDAGKYAYLEVSDTGVGMDSDTLARVFDPFFTTKFTGRGLGLVAVSGTVRGHNGAVAVSSGVGEGTTVRVLLPATTERDRMYPARLEHARHGR